MNFTPFSGCGCMIPPCPMPMVTPFQTFPAVPTTPSMTPGGINPYGGFFFPGQAQFGMTPVPTTQAQVPTQTAMPGMDMFMRNRSR